jgi:CheY-like chemotaxis protein
MKIEDIKLSRDLLRKSRYSKFQDFHNLMAYRVTDILLVSSLYDSYVFEEDGRLYELIRKEYLGLNLSHSPELFQVSSAKEALKIAQKEERFKLIIVTMHVEGMSAVAFTKELRKKGIKTPVVLLGYDNRDLADLMNSSDASVFDKIFVWQGDYRLLVGIIKFIEDKKNVENDVKTVGVQVILVVEDNVRYYSSFLPVIYLELFKQSQDLLQEGINLPHKFLRMRARPKIILCSDYEEAMSYYKKYKENILGIITDVDFRRRGKKDPEAGLKLTRQIKADYSDIPVLIQSNRLENEQLAYEAGAAFLFKNSPTLLNDLRRFMKENFSFGDFVFRNEKGEEVARAKNLEDLEEKLKIVPEESIVYHALRNHFSNWLKARTEFYLADKLRPQRVSDFKNPEELRQTLIKTLSEYRINRLRSVISEFKKETFDFSGTFSRIGGGSIGGKARGLSFMNSLIYNLGIGEKFDGVRIFVPSLVVIATDVFDDFLEMNNLLEFALRCEDDEKLVDRFINANRFPQEVIDKLYDLLSVLKTPIAVRSSSLLEDSQGQPFAGVYETIMLPNRHPDIHIRVAQLLNAIKHVYASTYYQSSKDYIKMTTYRLEEEKMAVIIQKLEGVERNDRFYPEISGVAKSYNFYPVYPAESEDGITSVALGLGKIITDGGTVLRFSPKYPEHIIQFSSVENTLKYSQHEFYAVELSEDLDDLHLSEDKFIRSYALADAEKDGTLNYTASTYSPENNAIYDGISRPGPRVFTLAPLLKHKIFPLSDIIRLILKIGKWGMGSPVEIEFAVNLSVPPGERKEFAILQMRPLVISSELEELNVEDVPKEKILCRSKNVLGNGRYEKIRDIVFVDKKVFDRSKTREVAAEITKLNSKLVEEKRPYLLIGMGRWGSLDPWLGIPVTWENICGVKTIVETNFEDMDVEPSQGSHFFQNLTSFKIGYFTVSKTDETNFVDWAWLYRIRPAQKLKYVRHLRLRKPVMVRINGKTHHGIICKPK